MFYEQSVINDILKCQKCNQSYDEYDQPRILPCCGKTLCNICINKIEKEVKNKLFKCMMCHDECYLPKKGFPINELASKLASEQPREVYRGEKCEEFKYNLNDLEKYARKLEMEMITGEDKIKDHCFDLKRLIQLATEKKMQEILSISELLIKLVDEYETESIESFRSNLTFRKLFDDLIQDTKRFVNEQKNYLNQFQIKDKDIIESNHNLNLLREKLEDKSNIKKLIFNDKLMRFSINKTLIDESFLGNITYEKIDTTFTVYEYFFLLIYNY
jgi:hypothetical protein